MKPDLAREVAYWQDLLRLRDWQIEAVYVRDLCDRSGSPVHGLCSYLIDNKTAKIAIRDPETPIVGDELSPEDRALLACAHEVVHLQWAPLCLALPSEIAVEEQGVWATSEALLKLRGSPHEQILARAMRAQVAAVAARRGAAAPQRSRKMDPKILAALKAALTAEDPRTAIEALLKELEAAGPSAPESEPMGMKDEPPMPADKEPMQMSVPKYQRHASVSLASVERTAKAVVQEGVDQLRRDLAVDRAAAAGLLNEAEARYARTLSLKDAEGFLALRAAKAPESAPSSQRNTTPTLGAPDGYQHPILDLVDRHMGVGQERPQVMVDRNGNMSISHLPRRA